MPRTSITSVSQVSQTVEAKQETVWLWCRVLRGVSHAGSLKIWETSTIYQNATTCLVHELWKQCVTSWCREAFLCTDPAFIHICNFSAKWNHFLLVLHWGVFHVYTFEGFCEKWVKNKTAKWKFPVWVIRSRTCCSGCSGPSASHENMFKNLKGGSLTKLFKLTKLTLRPETV